MTDDRRPLQRGAPPSNRRAAPGASTLLGIGASFGACVGIGAVLGILVDHAAGTSPLFVLLGVLMGILVGAFGAYQVIRPYVASSGAASQHSNDSPPVDTQHGSEG